MKITSAQFLRGVVGPDELLEDGTPQVAFIGRSNVGKSSVINSLTGEKGLARTSAFPGRTQEINIFFINKSHYFLDLPGYGYAKLSQEDGARVLRLIQWYIVRAAYEPRRFVLIVDAKVGLTEKDREMIEELEEARRDFLVVANKIDKIKKSAVGAQLAKIQEAVGAHPVIPFSAEKQVGARELLREILQ